MDWFVFGVSAGCVVVAGSQLTRYADILCDQFQLGKVWIGVALLGLVTSLPEAVTSFIAVWHLRAPDLAVGNMLGSNNFNPLMIVFVDAAYRSGAVTDKMNLRASHAFVIVWCLLATGIVLLEIVAGHSGPLWSAGSLSAGSWLIVLGYFAGMVRLSRFPESAAPASVVAASSSPVSLWRLVGVLVLSVLGVVAGALFLARSAETIASQTGLGETFFGSLFLAIVTSLPELIVTLTAMRQAALDLAFGNIFGSNMTNLFLIALCDGLDHGGTLLSQVSLSHVLTAVWSVLMVAVAVMGARVQNKKTFFGLGWDSYLLAVLFLIGMRWLYVIR